MEAAVLFERFSYEAVNHVGQQEIMLMKNVIMVLISVMFAMVSPVLADEIPTMAQQELRERLGSANLVVIDVRSGGDWRSSDRKILGAAREEPGQVVSWAGRYDKDKTVVLYCS